MSANATDIRATLMYAGEIAGRARFDIVDPARMNLAFVPHEVMVQDVRAAANPDLDEAGFTFVKHRSRVVEDPALFTGNLGPNDESPQLSETYLAELCRLLTELTGAARIFPQIGGLVARTSHRAARKSWALPANFVHLDYTANSARDFLQWSSAARGLTLPAYRRLAVYQTWRAISSPPQDNTLCICDGRSAQRAESITFDSVLGPVAEPGKFFEARVCRHGPSHRWYYLSDMEADDLLIFKGFDSDSPEAMNAMHTAFENPLAGAVAEPRRSVEARFIALFE